MSSREQIVCLRMSAAIFPSLSGVPRPPTHEIGFDAIFVNGVLLFYIVCVRREGARFRWGIASLLCRSGPFPRHFHSFFILIDGIHHTSEFYWTGNFKWGIYRGTCYKKLCYRRFFFMNKPLRSYIPWSTEHIPRDGSQIDEKFQTVMM